MDAVLSRRAALVSCAACLAAAAGCASYGTEEPDSGGESSGGSAAPAGGTFEATTGEIPVGGGKIFADPKVVITQPTAGEFKAFTAVCTHAGCTVASVGETIACDCHGSEFSLTDGSAVQGPASAPLQAYQATVSGDTISVRT